MRIFKIAMIIGASAIFIASLILMSGCSDIGHYDAGKIAEIAKSYYNDKYGTHEDVTAVHQEISYDGLFGYHQTGTYYCTMSDGKSVEYDEDDSACMDNRQQAEIAKAMGADIARALRAFEDGLDSAGYTWNWNGIDGASTEERAYRLANNLVHVYFDMSDPKDPKSTWEKTNADASNVDFQASYFATRYDGDINAFLAQEFSNDRSGSFPTSVLYLAGDDIPDTTVFKYSQSPKWYELAEEFLSWYTKRYNGNGTMDFVSNNMHNVSIDYARIGTCSFGQGKLSWSLEKWEEMSDGICFSPGIYEKEGLAFELVESDVDLERYRLLEAFPADVNISNAKAMEIVVHGAEKGSDIKWAGVRIGYDPSKYEIVSVQREALEEFKQKKDTSSNSNNNVKIEPVYVRHADVEGGYGLLDTTAYEKAGVEKATILIVKKIG